MVLLCRYGEIGLKGKNRIFFERKLQENMQFALKQHQLQGTIKRIDARFLVFCKQEHEALQALQKVFGLTSISTALITPLEYTTIEQAIQQLLEGKKFSTFGIQASRARKLFHSSQEIETELGRFVQERFQKKVQLDNPDLTLFVEIMDQAYLTTERIACFGGLPTGIEGKVLALLDSEESVFAAWLLMKRGCYIIPVALDGQKPVDITLLQNFYCTEKVRKAKDCKALLEIAREQRCQAMVTGQMLEQYQDLPVPLIIFRPLIAFEKETIKKRMEELYAVASC